MTKEETKQYFIDLYVKHIKQEDIPEWANWIATDQDGSVCCFEQPPAIHTNYFVKRGASEWETLLDSITYSQGWVYSVVSVEELLPHYPSQQKRESVQDKVEFEAVSGDQSLFDLVGADSQDIVVVKLDNVKSILALREKSFGDNIIAERKVKEKPYIPEVGHTYKLSKEHSDIFACVFVDNEGDVWSTCDGVMFTHDIDYLSRNNIKFIRVS